MATTTIITMCKNSIAVRMIRRVIIASLLLRQSSKAIPIPKPRERVVLQSYEQGPERRE